MGTCLIALVVTGYDSKMKTLILLPLIIGIAYCQINGNYGNYGSMDEKKYVPRKHLMEGYNDDHQNEAGRRRIDNDIEEFLQEYDERATLRKAKRDPWRNTGCNLAGSNTPCGSWTTRYG